MAKLEEIGYEKNALFQLGGCGDSAPLENFPHIKPVLGQIGPLVATKRPDINPKCVVQSRQANLQQLGPNLVLGAFL